MNVIEETFFFNPLKKKWESECVVVEEEHTRIRFVRHPAFQECFVYLNKLPNTPVAFVWCKIGIVEIHRLLPFLRKEEEDKIRKAYQDMLRDMSKGG